MPDRVKTFFVVACLSGLIWVFAERQVTQELTIDVSVEVSSNRPDMLVETIDPVTEQPVRQRRIDTSITISGPGGRLNAIADSLSQRHFTFDISERIYSMEAPLTSEQKVLDIVSDLFNGEIVHQGAYAQVLRCTPATITVQVTRLTEIDMPVRVIGPDGAVLPGVSVEPPTVQAYVKPGTSEAAEIRLSAQQQLAALREAITVACRVSFPQPGQSYDIRVRLSNQSATVEQSDIKNPRLGFLLPPNMEGRYRVEIEENSVLRDPIRVQGTPTAIAVYRASPFHLVLEINEQDQPNRSLIRPVSYYPPFGVRDELEIVQAASLPVTFRLIPVAPAEAGEVAAEAAASLNP